MFHRPSETYGVSFYGERVNIAPAELSALPHEDDVFESKHYETSSCVYFRDCKSKPAVSQLSVGRVVLQLWSQQWPSLRCSFSFRTTGRAAFGRSPLLDFDLSWSEGRITFNRDDEIALSPRWNSANVRSDLTADLSAEQPSELRDFISRYGEGLPENPLWIPFLAWVRRAVKEISRHIDETGALLDAISVVLPSIEEGVCLKTDLLSFHAGSLASLPRAAFPSVLEFLVLKPAAASFPPIQTPLYKLVAEFWQREPNRLFQVIRIAITTENAVVGTPTLQALSQISNVDALMESVGDWPDIRKALVVIKPELLRWSKLSTLEPNELLSLLDSLDDERVTRLGIVEELVRSQSFEVADYLCRRFPTEVLKAVCVGRGRQGFEFQANEFILQRAGEIAPGFLSEAFLNSLGSTSALNSFASMLGFINSRTVDVGPLLWVGPLRSASNDLEESEGYVWRSFLLGLALVRPERGAEYLFEYSFDPLHRAMRSSVLPYRASVIMEPQLPEVSWWRSWDNCHRLRSAVVQAYIRADLDPSSFLRLSTDADLMSEVFEVLESDYRARSYLAKVRAALDSPSTKHDSDTTFV
jgi:hypothetical protein